MISNLADNLSHAERSAVEARPEAGISAGKALKPEFSELVASGDEGQRDAEAEQVEAKFESKSQRSQPSSTIDLLEFETNSPKLVAEASAKMNDAVEAGNRDVDDVLVHEIELEIPKGDSGVPPAEENADPPNPSGDVHAPLKRDAETKSQPAFVAGKADRQGEHPSMDLRDEEVGGSIADVAGKSRHSDPKGNAESSAPERTPRVAIDNAVTDLPEVSEVPEGSESALVYAHPGSDPTPRPAVQAVPEKSDAPPLLQEARLGVRKNSPYGNAAVGRTFPDSATFQVTADVTVNTSAQHAHGTGQSAVAGVASEKALAGNIPLMDADFSSSAITVPTDRAAEFRPAPVMQPAPLVPAHAVAREIAHAALSAKSGATVELYIDPVEMGKLDIEFTLIDDRMNIIVRAEREDALDLMRRNSDELLKLLRETNVDLGSLTFSQERAKGQGSGNDAKPFATSGTADPISETVGLAPITVPSNRLDIRI